MEYYFKTDDKLDRRKYAEFLKSMLENCDKYRREDSEGAYVIAIDSPWGTGKTRFAKMLKNHLEGREPIFKDGKVDNNYIPEASDTRKFNVIYYNSWDTDYWNDALEPLIHSIYNSNILEIEGNEADLEKMRNALFLILKGMGIAILKLALGEKGAAILEGAIDGINEMPDDPLAAYKERVAQYHEFKSTLKRVIKRTKKKLVIIVDELDRCRPTFAIQTLELAKHLFAVDGLIFVFALDIRQLSCSVQTVYGDNMDAPGYLTRFFDYTTGLPPINANKFINMVMANITNPILIDVFEDTSIIKQIKYKCTALLVLLYDNNLVSLRDITTLTNNYNILLAVFLESVSEIV